MLGKLSLLAATLCLCLALGEGVVRLTLPAPGFTPLPVAETRGIMRPDPERGHIYAPNASRHVVTPDYEIDFRTNSLGLRDIEPEQIDPAALRVLAIGDSYTQGHGVQAEQAWPKRLQARLPGTYVFDAGVSGYGLQQMRRMAEVLLEHVQPRAIVIGVYANGYTRLTDPYVIVGDGAGLAVRSSSQEIEVFEDGFILPSFGSAGLRGISLWIDRHWFLAGHLMHEIFGPRLRGAATSAQRESPGRDVLVRELEPMLRELEALNVDALRWGAPLVALLVNPEQPEGGHAPLQHAYNGVIADFAGEHGICCVDPLPWVAEAAAGRSLRLGGDQHWSPLAHDLAAEHIVGALRRSLDAPASEAPPPCRPAARVLIGG